ncbi:hypothetical protein [Oryza sativa Japonica Group]|uniref:Uncharacterized protein n=2 Tax=Oryza sativa subsp. japonica TaxID=39947 RepID=Q5NA49_ORYSJ|nr:hypothetical protein [Oryza sativa Japonica Group]
MVLPWFSPRFCPMWRLSQRGTHVDSIYQAATSTLNTMISTAITRCGRYLQRRSRHNAPDSYLRSSSATRTISLSSASTSAVAAPALRMRHSKSRASLSLPRSVKLLGVSGMDAAPTMTMTAETMSAPSESGSGGETTTTLLGFGVGGDGSQRRRCSA